MGVGLRGFRPGYPQLLAVVSLAVATCTRTLGVHVPVMLQRRISSGWRGSERVSGYPQLLAVFAGSLRISSAAGGGQRRSRISSAPGGGQKGPRISSLAVAGGSLSISSAAGGGQGYPELLAVAKEVGIPPHCVVAGVLPSQKAEKVEELHAQIKEKALGQVSAHSIPLEHPGPLRR